MCPPKDNKESLVEWVTRTTPQPTPRAVKRLASQPANSPRLVPLAVWANLLLGEYAPHKNTPLRWVHEGRIYPQPIKVGRKWFLKPDAEYRGD